MNLAFLIFFSLSHQTSAGNPNSGGAPPPAGLCDVVVNKHGYKCHEFHVTTDDGYILGVHRIPVGRASGGGRRRPPVLLQHGIFMDGMTWVVGPTEESLAMVLADHGFDVWISNVRGTRYSRKHLKLDPNHHKFWDWTWDELVVHDLPSIVDLIFKQTGSKTHFVGHSMGTLMALASLSQGKLNKVKSVALLSPIAHLSHVKALITLIAANAFLGEATRMFGLAEFTPTGKDETAFLKYVCALSGVHYDDLTTTAFSGKHCCLNETVLQNFIKNKPQSTSTKNLIHFAQTIRHGILSKYDYGNPKENMEHYGEWYPPIYDMSKIPRDFPLFISYGGEDAMSTSRDVASLLDDLKLHHNDKLNVEFIQNYAHLDFVFGVNAKDILYNHLIHFFNKY